VSSIRASTPAQHTLAPAPSALPAAHEARVEESRRVLLAAIGEPADLTLIRGPGNVGDRLIHAGALSLLAGLRYREIGWEEVASARGELALISGSGAWCRPYHEIMPWVLALAEMRFTRVIVLPSSFDASTDLVRAALGRTRALVFARERESLRQVREICAARLAHDTAFFFDFSPYRRPGEGVLEAYRTDAESSRSFALPAGNQDISHLCASLDEWLERIAGAAIVRTDRAHVMIAGALLGKRVEYRASAYHKLPAIAEFALGDFPVAPARDPGPQRGVLAAACPDAGAVPGLEELRRELAAQAAAALGRLPAAPRDGDEPRVTVILLSHDRAEPTLGAIASLRRSARMAHRLLIVDNNSPPAARRELARASAEVGAELMSLDRNLGCAGGRQYAAERAATEYVMFLDNDGEVFPGTIELLVDELDRHPEAIACGGKVVLPDGSVQLCGGACAERDGVLLFAPLDAGLRFDSSALGRSGPCDWLAGIGTVARRAALLAFPLDPELSYYEDNEWCHRVNSGRPGAFRRLVEAPLLHHQVIKSRRGSGLVGISQIIPFLAAMAKIYRRHGAILEGLFLFVPELAPGGVRDLDAARLLLELVDARGAEWTLLNWLNGGLAPLLRPLTAELAAGRRDLAAARHELAAAEGGLAAAWRELRRIGEELARTRRELAAIHGSRLWRAGHAYWSLRRRLSGLPAPPADRRR
jgi:hypothetical protein